MIYKKMDKYLLGIDIGTSGCKSCVIDNKGKLIASACHEYSPLITRGRWVEQDPIDWYRASVVTMCTLPKILWMMRNEPDNWERTYKVIFPKDYINFKLTGNLQMDLKKTYLLVEG